MKNWKDLLYYGIALLSTSGIEDAEFDALQLLLTFFNNSYSEYCLRFTDSVSANDIKYYTELIERRINKEPLQYIIGKWDFYKSTFSIGEGVLIPRPETEELVEFCVDAINENKYNIVYDLCSGSGCIGLSIAKEFPFVKCFLFELYDNALYYLRNNLKEFGLQNVTIVKHNILESYSSNIPSPDLIVSNPPYIKTEEIFNLQKEVLREPLTALDGGDDGFIFYDAIKNIWLPLLNKNGLIAVECGEGQSDYICSLFADNCLTQSKKDIYGIDRFVIGYKNNNGG